jgi:hypothetical protein
MRGNVLASPSREEPGRAAMGELYGRYHGRILQLATQSTEDGPWKAKLREILAEFDDDCRDLSASDSRLLRHELASQIEHEVLRFFDPTKRAVLVLALKHFDHD